MLLAHFLGKAAPFATVPAFVFLDDIDYEQNADYLFFLDENVHIFEAFRLTLVKKNRQNGERRKMSGYLSRS